MKQVLVVTGGSQGIGAAVARLAAARGYAVALSYRRGKAQADAVVADIVKSGGQAIAVQADAADEQATEALFAAVDRALGPVTALVNNAGITGPARTLEDVTGEMLTDVMGINVNGCFLALREAARRMATDRGGAGGAIVNVSSRASELGGPNEWVHYAASKGAVDSFTIGAAKELAPRGIRVNAVNPGLIDTEIHAKAGMPDRTERFKAVIPMGRAGSAEEVAKVILWLLSDEASYVTGALVPVGGGR
ncbi:SDR family oxidoreductase [Limobrevibacterium gyesilva]|uniref:SDR family oxidoreductase n=1 Tax=Limobrevibacterium gyesilva TaxID=2991712 RepID=A0AA41YPV2_9PROT|nr:SDR family oxidoreductase [Limobrevibacterium gyesilva]MCW3474295.1 SDR family oxidoreductase [Limobrevibacterium gyesilva]